MQIAPSAAVPAPTQVLPPRGSGAEGFLAVLASLRSPPQTGDTAGKVTQTPEDSGETDDIVEDTGDPAAIAAPVAQLPAEAETADADTPPVIAARPQTTVQMPAIPQAGTAELPDAAPGPSLPADAPAMTTPADPITETPRFAAALPPEKPTISVAKAETPAPPTAISAVQAAADAGDRHDGAEDPPARRDRKSATPPAAAEAVTAAPTNQRPGPHFAIVGSADALMQDTKDTAPTALAPASDTTAPHTVERTTHAPRLHPTAEAAVSRQIAMAIERTTDGQTEIRLDPAELGRVRLTLHASDQAVTVTIHAERPETLDLIRRNMDSLTGDLRALGYSDIGLNLSGGTGNRQDRTGPQSPQFDAPALSPVDDPALPRLAAVRNGGLDLRL